MLDESNKTKFIRTLEESLAFKNDGIDLYLLTWNAGMLQNYIKPNSILKC